MNQKKGMITAFFRKRREDKKGVALTLKGVDAFEIYETDKEFRRQKNTRIKTSFSQTKGEGPTKKNYDLV